MPHVPRYATPELSPVVRDELTEFLREFEDIWRGPWSRAANTVNAGHAYVQALCVPAVRKSMEPLSARADVDRQVFYQFITVSPWSWEAVQQRGVEVGLRRGAFDARRGRGSTWTTRRFPRAARTAWA